LYPPFVRGDGRYALVLGHHPSFAERTATMPTTSVSITLGMAITSVSPLGLKDHSDSHVSVPGADAPGHGPVPPSVGGLKKLPGLPLTASDADMNPTITHGKPIAHSLMEPAVR